MALSSIAPCTSPLLSHPHRVCSRCSSTSFPSNVSLNVKWGTAQWLTGCFSPTPGSSCSKLVPTELSLFRVSVKGHQQLVARGTIWQPLLQSRFIYTSNLSDVDTVQLSELWGRTLKVERDPDKIALALKHSFAIVAVLVQGEDLDVAKGSSKKIIGFGRAVSDGAFIATVCDIAVDPDYQRRGIGRRIVKELVQNMKRRGGPTGFAVFPSPITRRFFWMIGFRSEKKYRFMAYRGRLLEEAGVTDEGNVRQGIHLEEWT